MPFFLLSFLHFELKTFTFPMEHSKVAFIITNLTGRVREWAVAKREVMLHFL